MAISHFDVVEPLVSAGQSLTVDFLVSITLYGARTLQPDDVTGTDVIQVTMFLSTDRDLDVGTDKEVGEWNLITYFHYQFLISITLILVYSLSAAETHKRI